MQVLDRSTLHATCGNAKGCILCLHKIIGGVRVGTRLNIGKTKTMTISRSRTMLPCFPELTLNDIALQETSELIILGVTFDPKLTFEQHVRSVASSASQIICLLRRARNIFDIYLIFVSEALCFLYWSMLL